MFILLCAILCFTFGAIGYAAENSYQQKLQEKWLPGSEHKYVVFVTRSLWDRSVVSTSTRFVSRSLANVHDQPQVSRNLTTESPRASWLGSGPRASWLGSGIGAW